METKNSVLFIYGDGGHKEQMKRLLKVLNLDKKYKKISLVEKDSQMDLFDQNYTLPPARGKYDYLKSLFIAPYFILYSIYITIKVLYLYNIKVLISTGPGVAIIPALIFRLLGKEVIFMETWSRFNTQSYTGRIMYKIANIFYIQNKSLEKLYPNSVYAGRL